MAKHRRERGSAGLEPEVSLVRQAGPSLPAGMDSVLAIDAVRRYVEAERQRSRRIVVWASTIFLFVVLVILTLFIAVGIFVVRNSRDTEERVVRVQSQVTRNAADASAAIQRVSSLEEDKNRIEVAVQRSAEERESESRMFKGDLERFGKWVASTTSRRGQTLEELERRLAELESRLEQKDQRIAELEREGPRRSWWGLGGRGEPASTPAATASAPETAEAVGVAPDRSAPRPVETAEQSLEDVRVVEFPNGDRYEGQVRDGLLDGWGVYYFSNGDRYEGRFRSDLKHGYGVLYFHNGDVYKGAFSNDRRDGEGTYLFAGGARYTGQFRDGKRHGRGRYEYENGQVVVGEFKDGEYVTPEAGPDVHAGEAVGS